MKGRIDPFDATTSAIECNIAVFEQEFYLLLGNTIKRWDLEGTPLPDITIRKDLVYPYMPFQKFIFHLKKAILFNRDCRTSKDLISIWTVGKNRPDTYPLEDVRICTKAVAWHRSVVVGMKKKGRVGVSIFHLDSLKHEKIYEENSQNHATPNEIAIRKEQLFLGKDDGRITVFDLLEKKALNISMHGHTRHIEGLSINNNDEILISYGCIKIVLWSLKTFTPISTLHATCANLDHFHLTTTQNSKLFLPSQDGVRMVDCLTEPAEEKEATV